MSMQDMSISGFAEILAAKTAVPGGGGASALVGALGAALASMVANFTVGKKQHAAVEGDIKHILEEADELRASLISCIDEDATAFEPLSRAYGIPKDDPERGRILEECLRAAAAVPMKLLKYTCRTIELHSELANKCSGTIVSDVGAGIVFCSAALYGSLLNIKVNTKLMADRDYAEKMNNEADQLVDTYRRISDDVYDSICRRFC